MQTADRTRIKATAAFIWAGVAASGASFEVRAAEPATANGSHRRFEAAGRDVLTMSPSVTFAAIGAPWVCGGQEGYHRVVKWSGGAEHVAERLFVQVITVAASPPDRLVKTTIEIQSDPDTVDRVFSGITITGTKRSECDAAVIEGAVVERTGDETRDGRGGHREGRFRLEVEPTGRYTMKYDFTPRKR
jgi:hypothetical protein